MSLETKRGRGNKEKGQKIFEKRAKLCSGAAARPSWPSGHRAGHHESVGFWNA